MSLIYIISIVPLSIIFGAIGAYAMLKYGLKTQLLNEKAMEIVADLIDQVSSDQDLQQKIYIIGGIFGQGVVKGSGLSGLAKAGSKGGGGMLMQLITGFLDRSGRSGKQQQLEQPEVIPPRRDVNRNPGEY